MTAQGFSISRSTLILLALFVLALALRLWGVNFGLPFLYNPDEGALTMPALNILRSGDFRPFRLDYGSAYIYSLTILYIPLFLYGAWRGNFASVADLPVFTDYHQIGAYSFPAAFLAARVLTAILGALTVLAIYTLGRRLAGARAGLFAAGLLAITPLHVLYAHFAGPDVPMTFVLVLALLRILDVYERGDWRDYIWAGLLVGLTASAKFPGGVVLAALLVAHLLRARGWAELANDRLAMGIAATIAGFLIGSPYALDLPYFLNWLAVNVRWYGAAGGDPGTAAGDPTWLFYLKELVLGPFGLIAIMGVFGLAFAIRRNWRQALVIIAFPVVYGALITLQTSRFPRFLIPLIPFLVLGAGIILDAAAHSMMTRWQMARPRPQLALSAVVVLFAILPLSAVIGQDALLAGPDVRTQAFDWFRANISSQAKVAAEPASVPLSGWSREVYLTWNLAEHASDWYADQNFDYVVVSEPRLIDPNLTARTRSAYGQLMNRLTLIKTFQGSMLGFDGLRIWVYRVKQ
jgi:4-amino-4-deoxy-L-arabinose transferase-like glycosyltransferase